MPKIWQILSKRKYKVGQFEFGQTQRIAKSAKFAKLEKICHKRERFFLMSAKIKVNATLPRH
jgi:hypothetical protein